MITRRAAVASLGAFVFTTGFFGGPKASKITVNVIGGAGMNPGPNGGDRPVVVIIYRLKSTGAFEQADYFALEGNASGTLGGDLLGFEQVAVAPGRRASQDLTVEPEATALGFVAFVREPDGKRWKSTLPIAPGSKLTISATLGKAGISLSGGKKNNKTAQDMR